MRSGVECVLILMLIRRGGSGATDDEFRPKPIPLNEWHEVRGARAGRAEGLRYWEPALRHSVYLAIVRDKIDKLIAKGDYSQEIDDRDLWDKVKRAPFERIETEESIPVGDVVTMARGRLMENYEGFRFTEDKLKGNCTQTECMDGVRALWSVKRERQRDADSAPGQYHYELTFSVATTQKKHKKRYEKPARTFTVRESIPERIQESPQEHRYYEPPPAGYTPRPERALWYHKNIMPTRNQARQHHTGLDRLFSSLFMEEDETDVPVRYKKQYISHVYQQNSKAGYVGSPSEQQQKKLKPHGPMLQGYKYTRPIPPPPQYHYLDIDAIGVVSNPYTQEHRYGPPNKQAKTPRPPVLPTPPNPVLPQKNFSIETTTKLRPNRTEETTPQPENVITYKPHMKQKPSTIKISYVTDHVRPPVYSAPPGVFVTMDKKPFKPMPPLRLVHSSKHHKQNRPVDFRPSPQVLDIQFSEPDPLFDTAFRPITVNYANTNTTDRAVPAASDHLLRQSNTTTKRPPKKHENIKAQRLTTAAPEIITAHSVEEPIDTEWASVLSAFAKTTPMAAERETQTPKAPESTTPLAAWTAPPTSAAPPASTTAGRMRTTTTTEEPTTPKPKKRTRPPHKFVKPEKVKKHKRITTTTEVSVKPKKQPDLTPQASSAAAAELPSSTTTTTTTEAPTTTASETSTAGAPVTSSEPSTTSTAASAAPSGPPAPRRPAPSTTEPPATPSETDKRKNRYRQSTLKYRSTSERLDKKETARTVLPPAGKFPPRRKGSKFHGHIPFSTPRYSDMQFDDEGREDHVVSPYKSKAETTTATSSVSNTAAHEIADRVYITSESPKRIASLLFDESEDESEDEPQSRGGSKAVAPTAGIVLPSNETNEIIEIENEPVAETVVTSSVSATKNKTKCKKKKHHNLTNTTEETKPETVEPEGAETDSKRNASTETPTTTETTTQDIFQEIFGGFTFDDSFPGSDKNDSTTKSELEEDETINHEKFIEPEEDFADFFEALEDNKERHPDGTFEEEYEYDDKEPVLDDDEVLFQSEENKRAPRASHDDDSYEDYEERPYSLLELMAME